jgi:hypothetical protein
MGGIICGRVFVSLFLSCRCEAFSEMYSRKKRSGFIVGFSFLFFFLV